jgi:hypothetical protein
MLVKKDIADFRVHQFHKKYGEIGLIAVDTFRNHLIHSLVVFHLKTQNPDSFYNYLRFAKRFMLKLREVLEEMQRAGERRNQLCFADFSEIVRRTFSTLEVSRGLVSGETIRQIAEVIAIRVYRSYKSEPERAGMKLIFSPEFEELDQCVSVA